MTTPILDNLQSPSDLKKLSKEDLKLLCAELRHDLISRVNQVGGHFASSLGVVEITVAMHALFNTPEDRIVWDVGHQAYIHKILTGRRDEILKVRKLNGISGFPKRTESPYDTFGVGHAGTSISAAIGMAEASHHDYEGSKDRNVIALIGDGAMTSGMAFEALNHSGQLHRKLIVILNDNEMSIAPNVGALSWAFSKTLTNKFSTSARTHFKSLVEKGLIPKSFYRALDRAEEATQGFFSTPAMLFESFGYKYIGPVDGNNIDQITEALERAKLQDGPVLIHALTKKGKGFSPAEKDPVKYHAVKALTLIEEKEDSSAKKKAIPAKKELAPTYTKVFGDTLVELCKLDKKIVGVTAAMPNGTGLTKLANELPDRYFDVGIAEQHAVTFAAGLACEGMKPVCAIYSTFLQRAYDQVIHDVCIQNLPVTFAIDRSGVVGADGPTHHGVFDIAYLRSLPNMVVMAPKNEAELRDMMITSAQYKGPISYRYPRGSAIGVDISHAPKEIEIGKAEIINSNGNDVLLIGIGNTVKFCEDAGKDLLAKNIKSTVLNARFIKPLDEKLISELIKKHTLVITAEDGCIQGGFGSAISELITDNFLDAKLIRLGIPDQFIEHGTQEELYEICGYNTKGITNCALKHFNSHLKKVS